MLQKGFTLIELMIVVAIIGILSMFALPAYQDYTKRTYVSEGMALATSAKMAATEVFSTQGSWPASNATAGLPDASKITGQAVAGINLKAGPAYTNGITNAYAGSDVTNIVIQYNQKVTGSDSDNTYSVKDTTALTLAPVVYQNAADQGSVKWGCLSKGATIEAKWLPANCRTEVTPVTKP